MRELGISGSRPYKEAIQDLGLSHNNRYATVSTRMNIFSRPVQDRSISSCEFASFRQVLLLPISSTSLLPIIGLQLDVPAHSTHSHNLMSPIWASDGVEDPFDHLPDEIISRILTIGSDDDLTPPSITWLTTEIHREPSSFARTAAQVCRRWMYLVHVPSNSHLWRMLIHFPTQPGGHVGKLRLFLRSARGCDLYVGRDYIDDLYNVEEYNFETAESEVFGSDERFHALLIALHMLEPYLSQIASMWIPVCPRHFLFLIQHIERFAAAAPRLHTLHINKDYSTTRKEEQEEEAMQLYGHYPGTQSQSSGIVSSLTHLRELHVYAPPRHVEYRSLMSMLCENLQVINFELEDPSMTCSDLQVAILQCPWLKSLAVLISSAPLDQDTLSLTTAKRLEQFALRTKSTLLFHIFSRIHFPNLRTLVIRIDEDDSVVADVDAQGSNALSFSVPWLQELHFRSHSLLGDKFLASLTGFSALNSLVLWDSERIPQDSEFRRLSSFRHDLTVPLPIPLVKHLELHHTAEVTLVDCLTQVDLANMTNLRWSMAFPYMGRADRLPIRNLFRVGVLEPVHAPSLLCIEIGWTNVPFSHLLGFLDRLIYSPMLVSLVFVSRGHRLHLSVPHESSASSMESLHISLYESYSRVFDIRALEHRLLATVKNLTIEMLPRVLEEVETDMPPPVTWRVSRTLLKFLRCLSSLKPERNGKLAPTHLPLLKSIVVKLPPEEAIPTSMRTHAELLASEIEGVKVSRQKCQSPGPDVVFVRENWYTRSHKLARRSPLII
jgi:hypothetical protein